jgi:UDP-N-acetylmuramoylalanine--D-glutamate ligase
LAPADPHNPNYHKNLTDYWRSKSAIYKYQKTKDKLIINHQILQRIIKNRQKQRGVNLFTFKDYDDAADGFFIDTGHLHLLGSNFSLNTVLPGDHNKENLAAAALAARLANSTIIEIQNAAAKFRGLEHRIEKVTTVNGIDYFNDSFSTTPENAIAAINSFTGPITLIAGGAEKNSNFKKLSKLIFKKVSFVVLLAGDATGRLEADLIKAGFSENKMKTVLSIKEAVMLAFKNTPKGGTVLLSPACASFGMFKNYKERGLLFKYEALNISE